MFYNYNKILTYNAMLNILIGERGVGKTYGAAKFCISQFLNKKHKFGYIRRFKTEITLDTLNGFLLAVQEEFPNTEFKVKDKKFYINGEIAGYALTLTEAQNKKGTKFFDVQTIIFDEFIIEDNVHHYLKNEVNMFLGICETLARLNNFRAFLLANSVTITNPYFLEFELDLPYNNDIKLYKDNLILVQRMYNKEYREKKKQTRFGRLVAGTSYSNYAIDNQFIKDNKNFIKKKTRTSEFVFTFNYLKNRIGVWYDYKSFNYYISKDIVNNGLEFSLLQEEHNPNTLLIKSTRNYICVRKFIEHFKLGHVFFENQKLKNLTYEIIKLLLI